MVPRYKLKLSDDVRDLIRRFHPEIKHKVRIALSEIIRNPLRGKSLRGELQQMRSLRVSKFRIIYRSFPGIVEVIAVGPRRIIYEETLRLIKKNQKEKS